MRKKYDAYYTLKPMIVELFSRIKIPDNSTILEPCVGDGAILKTLKELNLTLNFQTNDIDTKVFAHWHEDARRSRFIYDQNADFVITNPPFSDALEIMQMSYESRIPKIIFLVRLSFLEPTGKRSGYRGKFLNLIKDNIRSVRIFGSPRPSFAFRGTDNVTTCWIDIDKNFSWEETGITCPFDFITEWKK